MQDSDSQLSHSSARVLAQVMGLAEPRDTEWAPDELADLLKHQLAAPLLSDLGASGPAARREVETLGAEHAASIRTFTGLFSHPHPPLELLTRVKDFAKAAAGHPDRPLPREVASIIYLVSIVVARLRCGENITHLDDEVLRNNLEWALAQEWVDKWTRELLEKAIRDMIMPECQGGEEPP